MRSRPDTGSAATPTTVRGALARNELAATRLRIALARLLDLAEHDVLAVQHLARAGELTPTQLGRLLDLTSGGATALVQRLERRGFVSRTPHPADRRSTCLRLTAEIEELHAAALAPVVDDIAGVVTRLGERDAAVIDRFLVQVAATVERHADELARRAERNDAAAWPAPPLRLLS
jgi:DNA-binding MarR family transcriptional regulator